jgi:hypothetical protein
MTLWLPFQNTYLHNPRTVVEQTILRYAHFLQRFVTTKRTHQDINLNMVVRRPGKVCGDCADLSVVLVLLTPNACSYNIMYWIWGLRTSPGILFHMITHGPNNKTNKANLFITTIVKTKNRYEHRGWADGCGGFNGDLEGSREYHTGLWFSQWPTDGTSPHPFKPLGLVVWVTPHFYKL